MSLLNTLNSLRKTALLRSAGSYGFFTFLNSSIPFFMLPVLTRYLSPEEYGIASVFVMFSGIVTPFVNMNVIGAYSRAYFAQDRFDDRVYLGTSIITILCWGTFISFVLWLFSGQVEKWFSFPARWVWATSLLAITNSLISIVQTSWRVREKPISFGIFLNSKTFTEASLALLLVVVLSLGWKGRIFSIIISATAFTAIGIIIIYRCNYINISFNKQYLKHALNYGVPLIPHSLADIINVSISRLFLAGMLGMSVTGVFTAGYQIGNVMSIISMAFYQAFFPWAYKRLNESTLEAKKKLVTAIYAFGFFIIILSIMFGMIAPPLLSVLLGKKFASSAIYVIWIAVGYAFNGITLLLSINILYMEKTKFYAFVTPFAAVLNVTLNYILIKTLGPVGAAISSTITYFVILVITFIMAQKFLPLPWKEVFTSVRMRVFKK